VASPDVHVCASSRKIVMYFHSPSQPVRPFRQQMTYCAVSEDGVHFKMLEWKPRRGSPVDSPSQRQQQRQLGQQGPPPPQHLGPFYFRVFFLRGRLWALARNLRWGGVFYQKPGKGRAQHDHAVGPWVQKGPVVLPRMRHAAVLVSADKNTLHVAYSRVGDAPERILLVHFDVRSNDANQWRYLHNNCVCVWLSLLRLFRHSHYSYVTLAVSHCFFSLVHLFYFFFFVLLLF
jgi:hypothetical protein